MSAALRSFEAQWRARAADSLQPLREAAMKRFLKLGLPTKRDETWRYTDLRSLAAQSFVDASCGTRGAIIPEAWPSLADASLGATTLLMVNGCPYLDPAVSQINNIEISSIRNIANSDSRILQRFFEPASDADQRRWVLLNTALFTDGLYLKITGQAPAPLVILHVLTAEGGAAQELAHPRVIIDASPHSRATIIEHYVTQGEFSPLSNSNTHIALARNALLEHYRVYAKNAGATHIDSLDIHQAQDSHCKQFTIALGGGLVRSSLEAHLSQPGASLDSYS